MFRYMLLRHLRPKITRRSKIVKTPGMKRLDIVRWWASFVYLMYCQPPHQGPTNGPTPPQLGAPTARLTVRLPAHGNPATFAGRTTLNSSRSVLFPLPKPQPSDQEPNARSSGHARGSSRSALTHSSTLIIVYILSKLSIN
jgi:hypothetical protein